MWALFTSCFKGLRFLKYFSNTKWATTLSKVLDDIEDTLCTVNISTV